MTDHEMGRRGNSHVSPHPLEKRTKPFTKVAFVAYGDSRILAPFDDPEVEIWGLNAVGHFMHEMRFHRMFDPHPYEYGCQTEQWIGKAEWYDRWGGPVYMAAKSSPLIKNSLAYPLEKVSEKFRHLTRGEDYFASTHSYMIALAIVEGFRTIELWGFEFYSAKELSDQRSCFSWYLGFASAMGIEIIMPESVNVMAHDHLYGYEDDPTEAYNPENIAILLDQAGNRLNQLGKVVRKKLETEGASDHAE